MKPDRDPIVRGDVLNDMLFIAPHKQDAIVQDRSVCLKMQAVP